MTGEFDELPCGSGMPAHSQIIDTRDYLRRYNRKHGIRSVLDELTANGFTISFTTVQRCLADAPTIFDDEPEAPAQEKGQNDAEKRVTKRRELTRGLREELMPCDKEVGDRLKEIIGEGDALKKNCDIALLENKVRMGLNVILMEAMVERPLLMLSDMRGTAALIDALTVSAKVSGGAAFEVLPPREKPEANGDGMKDVTPKPAVASIEAFKNFRQHGK